MIRSTKNVLILATILSLLSCQGGEKQTLSPEKQKELFNQTNQEDLKPTIWDTGDTTITNEDRLDLFEPHVRDRGGAYVGVGSTQNFTLAAWAKSEWIWLMDFTRVVVATNKIHIAFLQECPTPEEFRKLWEPGSKARALEVIKKHYEGQPDYDLIRKAWSISGPFQRKRFRYDDVIHKKFNFHGWLNSKETYDHIRGLALKGRIQAVRGDLKGPITVKSIAEQAKKMGIVFRMVYYSNAEEYFPLGDDFRSNWTSIPVDDKSLIVRTISVYRGELPWAPGSELSTDRGFHYVLQSAPHFQKWLNVGKEGLRIEDIVRTGNTDKEKGITLIEAGTPIPEKFKAAPAPEKAESAEPAEN
ncbi:MAG TPA: hypothetical protein DEA96_01980 [Leptospiraceae bacterium]|nr:hypothetical protein [Spirochaetaceae bacterium]HBS03703.1 hypothetical protein [Leptospiraceae bacterium]|tara:strand:- start:31374 stop:32447 length:1074 start_codon:yes stop_codon:yes gene_type:complete